MAYNHENGSDEKQTSDYSFLKKVLIIVGITISTILLIIFIGYAISLLLLVFAGILLGIVLRSLRDLVSNSTGMPSGPSLAVVIVLLLTIVGGTGYILAPSVYEQAETLYNQAPEKWTELQQELWQYSWGKQIVRENPEPSDLLNNENEDSEQGDSMTQGVFSLFSITAGAVAGIVLIFVISIYIAAEPHVYTNGFLRLFPPNKRDLTSNILDEISMAIQWWLVGQLASMLILGTITTLGLWLLGMPYALILGIFTALMTFIPNLGPILAGIPTLLVAFTVSPLMALYVGIFFVIIQSIEGYFITPMIHREMIKVPPALIITFQFLLYYLIGIIGVFVAMPLVACLMIIIQRVYVEQILGDSMQRDIDQVYKGRTII